MSVTNDLARYRTISRLGIGGMARVDLAEDTVLRRPVALKRMPGASDDQATARLRREALAGASLSHPNVVPVYDVVTSDTGELTIVMEYVEGETLRDALDRRGPLGVQETLAILQGAAAGLDAIHAQGIVHRDVKPSNILLGRDGAVKIADLGIAAMPDRTRITSAGSVLGSLSYMAPEQLEDGPTTPAIDIYALAAVAYEMLSGVKARRQDNPLALAHALATQPPPDLRDDWARAPAAAAEVLRSGLSRNPRERPRSAGELVTRLRAALEPGPRARTAPTAAIVGAPPDRRWIPIVVPLALVAVVAALAAILSSGGSPSHPPAKRTHRARAHRSAAASHVAVTTTSTTTATSSAPPITSASATSTPPTTTPPQPTPAAPGPAAGGPAAPGPPGAGNPISEVEAFYEDAAAHQYPAAWALADPTLRGQLEGYQAFQAGQAGDRSITFHSANVVNRNGQGATIAITTTSVRNNGTQQCSGTVDVVKAPPPQHWLLHTVDINCT